MGNHNRTEIISLAAKRKETLRIRKQMLADHRKKCGMDGCTCGIKKKGLPPIP